MTDITIAPSADTTSLTATVAALIGQRVGYAENAFTWYPGDPRRSAVGDALAWRRKNGVYEVEVHWWTGHTRWERADKLVAIEGVVR